MSTRPSTRPLTAALSTIPDEAWTAPSNYADNRVHHLYQRCDLISAGEWVMGVNLTLLDLLAQFSDIHDAWLSRIQHGGYIVPHTDRSRWRERWHIPIQTSGITTLDGEPMQGIEGVPFQLKHWLPHSVDVHHTDRDRIHLVIDLDRYVGPDEARPFVLL